MYLPCCIFDQLLNQIVVCKSHRLPNLSKPLCLCCSRQLSCKRPGIDCMQKLETQYSTVKLTVVSHRVTQTSIGSAGVCRSSGKEYEEHNNRVLHCYQGCAHVKCKCHQTSNLTSYDSFQLLKFASGGRREVIGFDGGLDRIISMTCRAVSKASFQKKQARASSSILEVFYTHFYTQIKEILIVSANICLEWLV